MEKGQIIKTTGSWYTVRAVNGEKFRCRIRGKMRTEGFKNTNPVVVGDYVDFEISDSTVREGIITGLNERTNYIVRKSTNYSKQSHIIAANLDQAFLLVTIAVPETSPEFIDRFLMTAEAYRIPASLVFNKIDMFTPEDLEFLDYLACIYKEIGYPCYRISALKGTQLDELKAAMAGKITLLSGNSGVGKTTLINTIEPHLKLKVGEISEYHLKGKHTTTFAEMVELSFGGFLIDTPGIKGFGLINMEKEELYHFFPEIFRHASGCQYYNCTHTHEPGCAVKKAVENGAISESRYNSYLNIFFEKDNKHRI
ncbi:MAG: ribosome small subunit-dependent GTPase A [Bacteroidota bacterium]